MPTARPGPSTRPTTGYRRWLPPTLLIIAAAGLVVVAARVVLPVNREYYELVVDYDPQPADQQYLWGKVTAAMTATSGYVAGQLLAMAVGVLLARTLRSLRLALAAAVPAAVLLAAVNFATAWLLSADARHDLARSGDLAAEGGLTFTPDLLTDPGFLRVLAAALAMFPVLAAAGVGLGALLRPGRVRPVLTVVGVAAATFACSCGVLFLDNQPAARLMLLVLLLAPLPPAATTPAVAATAMGGPAAGWLTATMLVTGVAWACLLLALAARAARRRPPQRAATGTPEPTG